MILFLVSIVYYSPIKLNSIGCIDSHVFFHSDISGHWLWNLQGIYSLVLEGNEEVPHKIGDQGLECHILFVSDLMKFSYDIIYNNIISLFQILFNLLGPPILHRQDYHLL